MIIERQLNEGGSDTVRVEMGLGEVRRVLQNGFEPSERAMLERVVNASGPTKVKLTYFKSSGKYYTSGEFESAHPATHLWKIVDEVRELRGARRLPGLVEGLNEFDVLIEAGLDGVPHLLPSTEK
jgi:hypothetical protein